MQEQSTGADRNPNSAFHDTAPFQFDRAAAWEYITAPGDVYEINGQWYLTSPEAVRFAYKHFDIFSSAKVFDELPINPIPVGADRPDHARYRRILEPMFAPRTVNKFEDALRAQVGEIIDRFATNGSCEIVQDLALPFPTQVIMTMFGFPLEDRDKLMAWNKVILANSTVALSTPSPKMAQAVLQLCSYAQGFIDKKRGKPADDLISTLLSLTGDDAWNNEELLGLAIFFALAGLDAVSATTGFVFMHLAQNPELQHRIVADPSLIPRLVEEVLRLEPSTPFIPRVTIKDVEVCGKTIPAGSYCHLAFGAVNRAGRGDSANCIDLSSAEQGHLSFGGGIHRCIGSHLSRLLLRIIVEEFHKRISEYTLVEGFQPEVAWPSGAIQPKSLPIVFPVKSERITLDSDKCAGHGRCYILAPQLFQDDERGYATVVGTGEISPESSEIARKAVRACPERAISIKIKE